ncbi:MAG: ATP-binding protein [Chthoniobacterales bacterium]
MKETITEEQPPELQPMPDIIAKLIAEQGDRSDSVFCREYNFGYADTTWSRVRRWVDAESVLTRDITKKGENKEVIVLHRKGERNPNYGQLFYQGSISEVLNECESMYRRIQERKALASKVRQGTVFITFPHFQTLLDRVTILHGSETQNRLLVYLADSGGGKTAFLREAAARTGGLFIEARESWRDSYFSACVDLCRATGITENLPSSGAAEKALIEILKVRKTVLLIDEGEYFGPKSINLIKLILNQTPTVVIICAIPELWNRIKRIAWMESLQIVRRTDHVETLTKIHPADVQKFMDQRELNLNGSSEASCKLIARHANEFGRYDLITRVADRLGMEEPQHLSDVESTVLQVKAMMGFTVR